MATGGPVYRSTKETENYERLCRAFVDLSTDVYRDILRYYMFVEPSELWNEVNACLDLKNKLPLDEQNKLTYSVHNCTISNLDLSFLYKLIRSISDQNLRLDLDKNIQASSIWTKVQADRVLLSTLSRIQEDKVKRGSRIGNYSECDCLLLSILLHSQCRGYQLPALVPTSNRWGVNPRPTDVKLGDDIERIRNLRNSRYGHVSDTCIPDPDFKAIWTELTEIMSRMDKELQTGGYYSTALAELEKTNLDGRWEKYETKIKELNINVKLAQFELHKQKKDQEKTTHQVTTLSSEQKDLVEKHEDITQQVATLKQKQKYTAVLEEIIKTQIASHDTNVAELSKGAKRMENRLEKQEDSTAQLQTGVKQMERRQEMQEDSTGQLKTGVKQMKSRLEKQEDFTGQLQTGVKQIMSRLDKQEDSTGQLQKGVSSLNKSIAEMGGKVDVMQTQVTSPSLAQDERQRTENKTVLALKENIVKAKQYSEVAKQLLNEIKKASCATEAEKKEPELREMVDEWKTVIRKAVSLQEKLQRTCAKDDVLSSDLDLEYLHSAEERGHKHNIRGLIYEASTEIKLKREEISLGKLKSWTNNQKSFYPTKATEHIYKEVKSKRNCLTTGLPGSGKTANLQHVALRLKNEGHRLCCVQTFKELLSNVDTFGEEEKQVYFVDDVFEVHGVSEDKTKEWTGADKDDLERCLNNTNISILCSSRKQVIDDPKLSNIKSHFTIISISEGELGLSSEEHVGIFEKHAITKQRKNLLTENKDQLKTEIKEKVRELKCPVGCFPLVCHLYTGEEEPKQTIEKYFNKPLNVITDHLEQLKVEDRLSHFCLLLCLMYDNKLPVNIITVGDENKETKKLRKELLELCKLPVATSREEIREKMDTLLQTFVKLEGDAYQCVYDIIHDAVIQHVSSMSSSLHQFIVRYCSSKFMRGRVHLSGVVCKDKYGRGHDTESCINIRPDSYTCWGVRVLDIVRDGVRTSDQLYNDIHEGRCSIDDDRVWYDNPWRDVFKCNRCVHSTEGQEAIVEALKSSDVETILCKKGYSFPLTGPRVTGLHWAMEEGLTHIVTQTVSMLSPTQLHEVDSIDGRGLLYLALCRATGGGCGTDVIQALIVGGADVNTRGVRGNTPLRRYVSCGDYKITQLLVDNGADVNQCDEYGESVLYESQLRGYDTITELLQSRGAVCIYRGKRYNHVMDIPYLTL